MAAVRFGRDVEREALHAGPGSLTCLAMALCSAFAMGSANASLIGDEVTLGHYAPDAATAVIGASPPATFNVAAGASDIYTFYNSHPFGYLVDLEASSIRADFNYLSSAAGTWPDRYDVVTCIVGCTIQTVLMSFNGLAVSGLNDSSGHPLQDVVVNTNMVGWNSSRLAFGADSVSFDWKGLSFDNSTYLEANLTFGPVGPAVPEPGTAALMLMGLVGLGFAARVGRQWPSA